MLSVVENFAISHSRSLKVIPIYTVEWGMCKFLLVFHCRLYLCFVGFQRYSTTNSGVPLKSRLGIVQRH